LKSGWGIAYRQRCTSPTSKEIMVFVEMEKIFWALPDDAVYSNSDTPRKELKC
jgi:hypothetical protein